MPDLGSRKRSSVNKPKPRKKEPSKATKSSNFSLINNAGYISTFILIILTLFIYDVIFLSNVDVDVNFHILKTELVNNVHKQGEAVTAIVKSLDKIEKNEQLVEIVNFIGSVGVGKTLVANILKRHFLPSVYEFRGSPVTCDEKILSTIKNAGFRYNLLVFDDLTIKDLDVLLVFLQKLPVDVNMFVICIFNIEETDQFLNFTINYDHVDVIEDKFNKSGVIHETAKFGEFTTDDAKEWIVKQLEMKGVDVQFHSKIIESALANQNVKYHGLKGLSPKLNLEV